jgi:hypothetical protein
MMRNPLSPSLSVLIALEDLESRVRVCEKGKERRKEEIEKDETYMS